MRDRARGGPAPFRLLSFLTPGNGLEAWHQVGILDRELAVFRKFSAAGWQPTLGSFRRESMGLKQYCEPCRVLWVSHTRVLPLLTVVCLVEGLGSHLVRTNQSLGAWHIVRAARWWRRPVVLRCGYVRGEAREELEGATPDVIRYQRREGWAFRNATLCHVPSERLRQWVIDHYSVSADHVEVVPNFVDFRKLPPRRNDSSNDRAVVSIGRLVPEKRFDLLLKACHVAGASKLTILGQGPEKTQLKEQAEHLGVSLAIVDRIPNCEIPEVLRSHQVYAHVSRWEGQPKALLEAMATAMPVVVSGAEGSLDLVVHGETGMKAAQNPEDIGRAIQYLFKNRILAGNLGAAAQDYVAKTHSIDRVVALQLRAYRKILGTEPEKAE